MQRKGPGGDAGERARMLQLEIGRHRDRDTKRLALLASSARSEGDAHAANGYGGYAAACGYGGKDGYTGSAGASGLRTRIPDVRGMPWDGRELWGLPM